MSKWSQIKEACRPTSRVAGLLVVVVVGLFGYGCSSGPVRQAVSAIEVAPLCASHAMGNGTGWAASCKDGRVVNVDTGAELELKCPSNDKGRVDSIVRMPHDIVVVYGCKHGSAGPETMMQSLVARPNSPPVGLGFPAYKLYEVSFSKLGDDGGLVMVSGKCFGILVYLFDSPDQLKGHLVPVNFVEVGDYRYELDGNKDFDTAPRCETISSAAGVASNADGSLSSLGLARPAKQSGQDGAADIFVGGLTLEYRKADVVLVGRMSKVAGPLPSTDVPMAVSMCGQSPRVWYVHNEHIFVTASGVTKELVVRPTDRWMGISVGVDGRMLLNSWRGPEDHHMFRIDKIPDC